MKLSKCIENVEVEDVLNYKEDIEVSKICFDSREVICDSLFVAIRGQKIDGHQFLKQVVSNQAVVLCVNEFDTSLSVCQIKVKDSRKALSTIANNFYSNPSQNVKVVGITATNGKTTTSMMIDSIFLSSGKKTALLGTVVNKVGNIVEKAILTTPESVHLQHLFSKMKEEKVDVCTMEVSSLALEMKRVQDVDFDVVLMSNVSAEHIDEHGSFEIYFHNKQKLITTAKKDAIAILNIDDTYVNSLKNQTKAQVITYSCEDESAMIYCNNIDINKLNPTFTVNIKEDIVLNTHTIKKMSFDVQLSVSGYHSVMNAVSAISCALALQIPKQSIIDGLKQFMGVERRFQNIHNADYRVFDDHFANEGNVNATMKSLSMMHYERLVMLMAIRGNRGISVNKDIVNTMLKWYPKHTELILTASSETTSDKDRVSEKEKEAIFDILKRNNISYTYYDTLHEAMQQALTTVKKDDILMLCGSQGMDYGAKIMLEVMQKVRPEENIEDLKNVLKTRIAGV